MDGKTFSQRNNAKRAAEKIIEAGTAPSVDYGIHMRDDGRFEIAWRTAPTTDDIAQEIATASAAADPAPATASGPEPIAPTTEADPQASNPDDAEDPSASELRADEFEAAFAAGETEAATPKPLTPDPWPAGTRVKIRTAKNRKLTGAIVERADETHWHVHLDFAAEEATVIHALADIEAEMPSMKPRAQNTHASTPTATATEGEATNAAPAANRPKTSEGDAAAARGIIPEKPIVTSRSCRRSSHRAATAATDAGGSTPGSYPAP
jgi:hypothetical protein